MKMVDSTGQLPFTLDQLAVLDAIERTGTFAGASKALHRVPSAISYTVRGLEEALGVVLFDRSGHRAVLTADGRRLVEPARALLLQGRRIERLAAELRGGWEAELEIVVDGAFPLGPIIAAVQAFSRRELPTQVQLRVEYLGGVAARFRRSRADVMLCLEPPPDAGLTSVPLPPLELVLVAAPGHALAGLEGVRREDLVDHVELVVAASDPTHDGRPQRLAIGSAQVFRLSDFLSKRIALLGGAGYGWLPTPLANRYLGDGRLVELALTEGSRFAFAPRLMHRSDGSLGRGGQLFEELLHEEFARALA